MKARVIVLVVSAFSSALTSSQVSDADVEELVAAVRVISAYNAGSNIASWCKDLPGVSVASIDEAFSSWKSDNSEVFEKAERVLARWPEQQARLDINLAKTSDDAESTFKLTSAQCAEFPRRLASLKETPEYRVLMK